MGEQWLWAPTHRGNIAEDAGEFLRHRPTREEAEHADGRQRRWSAHGPGILVPVLPDKRLPQ